MEKGCTAVVVAAGSARRMQGIDKIMTPVGGVPLLLQTVRALAASRYIDSIVIVTRRDLLDEARALCAEEEKLACVAAGGESRAESVRHGLDHVTTELVAVHDGARPLVSGPVIAAAVEAGLRWARRRPPSRCMTRSKSPGMASLPGRQNVTACSPCRRLRYS